MCESLTYPLMRSAFSKRIINMKESYSRLQIQDVARGSKRRMPSRIQGTRCAMCVPVLRQRVCLLYIPDRDFQGIMFLS
jgi:hypothetical protein